MSFHTDKLGVEAHTHTQTDAGNNNTRRPKLASGRYVYSSLGHSYRVYTGATIAELHWNNNQGCHTWKMDLPIINQKLLKISKLNDIFSFLRHELLTENFSLFPCFAENWPKSSLLRPKIPYRTRKLFTTWQPWKTSFKLKSQITVTTEI